jgi:hypothetical protein
MLNVHHRYYVKGRRPWEYPNFSLVTLCRDCHEDEHFRDPAWEDDDNRGPTDLERSIDWICGGNVEIPIERLLWDIGVEISMNKINPQAILERFREIACKISATRKTPK